MANDSAPFRYADLFAGIGGFHAMLDHAGGRCVYVSEIDREARQTYLRNWVDPLPEAQRPIDQHRHHDGDAGGWPGRRPAA